MMFPPLPWETIGHVVSGGLLLSTAVGGIAAGACALLTVVTWVQRHRHGRPAPTRWRSPSASPAQEQAPR
jgi:hypothetical protein